MYMQEFLSLIYPNQQQEESIQHLNPVETWKDWTRHAVTCLAMHCLSNKFVNPWRVMGCLHSTVWSLVSIRELHKGWIDSHVASKMQATHTAASASVTALKHHRLSGMVITNRFLPMHLASSISPRSSTRRLRGLSGSRRRTGTVILICA